MEEKKKKKTMRIVKIQAVLIIVFLLGVYFLYPKTDVKIIGNSVRFETTNANVIILSENPDFSNPRYIEFQDKESMNFNLKPGTYYWKASNGYIEGLSQEFTIKSEVEMKIDIEENSTKLVNVGNVKLNVTKNKDGIMTGHIILEPSEKEEIENEGKYLGAQHE